MSKVLTVKGRMTISIASIMLLSLFSGLFIAGNNGQHKGAIIAMENSFEFDGDQLIIDKVAWYEGMGGVPRHTHILSPDGQVHRPISETPTKVVFQLSPGKLDPIDIGWKLIAKQ